MLEPDSGSMDMENNVKAAVVLGFALLVAWAGMSFASVQENQWGQDGWRLLAGTVALSLGTLHTLSLLGGRRAALRFMAGALAISWLAETVGLHGVWPFGGYRYHPDLRPLLPGGVPVFIPLAWFVLAGIPALLLKGLQTTRADGRRDPVRLLHKIALSAIGMVACDLALDPIAVSLGLWQWDRPGAYFGVPAQNFAGWGLVSLGVFGAGYGLAGFDRRHPEAISLRYDLAWGAAHVGLLVLLGCAVSSRTGSGQPVLAAMVAMSPLSARWLAELYGKVRSCRTKPAPI